jgi:hypothetical protein
MPPTSESAVKQALAWFCSQHRAVIGSPYLISFGKDQVIMKQIVGTYGVYKTFKLVEVFFKELSTDKFLQQTGASVGIFKSQIPKLLLKVNEQVNKEKSGRL